MPKKLAALTILSLLVFTGCTTASTSDTATDTSSSTDTSTSFTQSEVAQHNSQSDCWMIIDGNVYDATSYISRHPGGVAILDGCGKDATTMFENRNGEGSHSSDARAQLASLQIGVLAQ